MFGSPFDATNDALYFDLYLRRAAARHQARMDAAQKEQTIMRLPTLDALRRGRSIASHNARWILALLRDPKVFPPDQPPTCIEDVTAYAGLQYLARHRARLGYDPSREIRPLEQPGPYAQFKRFDPPPPYKTGLQIILSGGGQQITRDTAYLHTLDELPADAVNGRWRWTTEEVSR